MLLNSERKEFYEAILNGCHFRTECSFNDVDHKVNVCDQLTFITFRFYKDQDLTYYHVTNDDRRKMIRYLEAFNPEFLKLQKEKKEPSFC